MKRTKFPSNPSKEMDLILESAKKLDYEGTDNFYDGSGTGSLYATIWYNKDDDEVIRVKVRCSDHPTGYNIITMGDYDAEGNEPEFLSCDPSDMETYQVVAYLADLIGKEKPDWVIRRENQKQNHMHQ